MQTLALRLNPSFHPIARTTNLIAGQFVKIVGHATVVSMAGKKY